MKQDQFIRMTKLEALNDCSKFNSSTNMESSQIWWAEGFLYYDIKVGELILMNRVANAFNPKGRDGIFNSSVVKKIEGNKVYTTNSVYLIESKKFVKDNYPMWGEINQ